MAYCESSDLFNLLPESVLINLSNDTAGESTVNEVVVGEMIDQADREIDSYLSIAGHTVPMDPVPPLVANLSAKMAVWNLHLRKYFNSEIWKATYESCQKILLLIANGKLSVGMVESGVSASAPGGSSVYSRTQEFTQKNWDTF